MKKIKEQSEEIKEKIQTSKEIFASVFAFARCKRVLKPLDGTSLMARQ